MTPAKIGALFGPIMLAWFVAQGARRRLQYPSAYYSVLTHPADGQFKGSSSMIKPQQLRAKAGQLRRLAQQTSHSTERQRLLELAEQYEEWAQDGTIELSPHECGIQCAASGCSSPCERDTVNRNIFDLRSCCLGWRCLPSASCWPPVRTQSSGCCDVFARSIEHAGDLGILAYRSGVPATSSQDNHR
jgi:hypothetical protein